MIVPDRRARYLKVTMGVGRGLKLRIVERPGLSLSPRDLEALAADLRRVAETYFKTETMALAVLGDVNGFKADRSRLEI